LFAYSNIILALGPASLIEIFCDMGPSRVSPA
jgi:hypothetical protein